MNNISLGENIYGDKAGHVDSALIPMFEPHFYGANADMTKL